MRSWAQPVQNECEIAIQRIQADSYHVAGSTSRTLDVNTQKPNRWLWAFYALFGIALSIGFLALAGARWARRNESINCASHVRSIVYVARMWAEDHGNRLPPDIISISNELSSPIILHCPSDRSRQRISKWSAFTPGDSSYEVASPGGDESDTNAIVIKCTIHGHLGYVDRTVFDGDRRVRERRRR